MRLAEARRKNYYELLNVDVFATAEQIESAYRELVKVYAPLQLHHGGLAVHQNALGAQSELFELLTIAYQTLIDADRRERYDRSLQCEGMEWESDEINATTMLHEVQVAAPAAVRAMNPQPVIVEPSSSLTGQTTVDEDFHNQRTVVMQPPRTSTEIPLGRSGFGRVEKEDAKILPTPREVNEPIRDDGHYSDHRRSVRNGSSPRNAPNGLQQSVFLGEPRRSTDLVDVLLLAVGIGMPIATLFGVAVYLVLR